MGLFDAFKNCQCKVCNKQLKAKEAIRKKNWRDVYLCPSCDEFLEKNYIYLPFDTEHIALFKKNMSGRLQKYQDIFQPTLHYGSIHIDPKQGLFSCCDKYIPGKNVVYGFNEFQLEWTFRVLKFTKARRKSYKATGYYQLWFHNIDWKQNNKGYYGFSIMRVPATEIFTTEVEFYGDEGSSDDLNFYEYQVGYAENMNEIIHQYFRNADSIRFDTVADEEVSSGSGSCEWFLFNGGAQNMTARRLGMAYSLSNLRYDRCIKDGKEVLACLRLDRAFASCLATCGDNADMKYQEFWVDVYYDIISNWWFTHDCSKSYNFMNIVEVWNKEFRNRIKK